MKHMKRLASLLLALTLVFALAATAGAATTYSITINDAQAGHTYSAYQIFAGDLTTDANGSKILSNIVFGTGVSESGKTALLSFEKTEGAHADAAALAETLTSSNIENFAKAAGTAGNLGSAAGSTQQNASGACTISGLNAGYYLVVDSYTNGEGDKSDSLSRYMIMVVGDATANSKHSFPTLDKQINHNETDSWEVVGDNQIGDTVEFRTITTVPDTTGYTAYDYVIHDTMSVGLTSNVTAQSGVTIKVNDKDTGILDTSYYTVTVDTENSNKFSIKIDVLNAIKDNKMAAGNELYTYYSGVLNESAKIYDEGKQDNVAYLEYSNNPNDVESHGKTPEKRVYDWTFKMVINKVNEKGATLTGAVFVLSETGTLSVENMNCDKDTGVPSATTGLIGFVKVSEGTYRIATIQDETSTIVYTIEAGTPVIKGLDDATDYYLYETKAPDGYNLLDKPVKFKITAAYGEDGSTVANGDPTVIVDSGDPSTTMSTNVVNKSGSTLPETGGVGTTLFYVLGGILVAGAVVLLVTKKRMNSAE